MRGRICVCRVLSHAPASAVEPHATDFPIAGRARPPRADRFLLPSFARRRPVAGGDALALATLSKGVVALAIPGAVLVLYVLVQRDLGPLQRLHPIGGLALFFGIVAPWFVAVGARNDEFPHFFFVHEHVQRFLSQAHRREGAWWYFVPYLLAGGIPWIGFVAVRLHAAWFGTPGLLRDSQRLLLLWAAFVFVFFSASGSKLPSYILPMFPASAIAGGLFWRGRRRAAIIALALGSLAAELTAMAGHDELSTLSSAHSIVQRLRSAEGPIDPTVPFYSVRMYDQTLPFYLGRPVTLVEYVDEFELGLRREPGRAIATTDRWIGRWRQEDRAYAIMQPRVYAELAASGVPMREVARDPRRVVVSRT